MNIQTLNKKIELIQWLSTLEETAIIEKLFQFKRDETQDWWENISKEEKASIEKGISEANEGKLEPHATTRKIYEKWL